MEKYKKECRETSLTDDINLRMNKAIGQLNGIKNMVNENRYCVDILTQLSAVESALKELGYIILKDHLLTCVSDDVKNDKLDSLIEAFDISKRLN